MISVASCGHPMRHARWKLRALASASPSAKQDIWRLDGSAVQPAAKLPQRARKESGHKAIYYQNWRGNNLLQQQITCILASFLCFALPQPATAQDAKKPATSAPKPVELNEKVRRGLEVLREMKAPAAGLNETERYARQPGPLGLHARDALEFGYGYNWDNDDSLSRREKHLILIAALITMERGHELEAHLKLALENGVKLEDYEPMLALLTPFIGLPAASNAAGKMHCLMVADSDRPTWCPPTAKAGQE